MEGHRTVLGLLVVAGWFLLGGLGCAWLSPPPPRYALPQALPQTPTLDQVIQVVNANGSQIHSFSTDAATLSIPGIPSLRSTSVAFERPRRLRLRAGTGITGTELDLGSNDELFWIWVKSVPPLYYCRHDQFASSPARHVLPIDPEWLIEALGIVELDPTLAHQGPTPIPGGRLEIRTQRQGVDGLTTKITLVDAATGVVVEQQAYDAQGHLIARASASHHRRDPLSNLVMPRIVEIECPKAQFSMRIDLGNVSINRPLGNPAELWAMPTFHDWPTVDLGNPNLQLAPATSPVAAPAASTPRPALRPSRPGPPHRGWNRVRF